MIKLLAICWLLLCAISVMGANPAFSDFTLTQFQTNGLKLALKDGPITTNLNDTGTTRAQAIVSSNQLTLLTNPIPFGLLRADAGGTNFNGTTNVSDLQATNLTVVQNTTLQNLTVNNTFTVNGKNGMSGTLTAGFLPMAGTASVFSNSIAKQNGLTDIQVNGSFEVTNALAVQSLVVSNTASGITPTAAAHFSTKGYVDTAFAQQSWPLASDYLITACFPRSDSATMVWIGEIGASTSGTVSAVPATATIPGHLRQTTGATIGNVAGWEVAALSWCSTKTLIFDCSFSLAQAVSNRFWAGFCVGNFTTMAGTDDPNTATAAIRFAPETAGDTQLMCFTRSDAGVGLDNTASGLTVVSNTVYRIRIIVTPLVSTAFYTNGVLAYTSSVTPTNTALMGIRWGVSTRVAAARNVDWFGTSCKSSYP